MPYRLFLFLILSAFSSFAFAQIEEAYYEEEEYEEQNTFRYHKGFYVRFENFINNKPIAPEAMITNRDFESRDFYFQMMRENKLEFSSDDSTFMLKPAQIWGYCDGKAIWINKNNFPVGFFSADDDSDERFVRIIDVGTLSVIYYVRQIREWQTFSTPGTVIQVKSSRTRAKPAEFILDTRTGKIHKVNVRQVGELIADDAKISKEFTRSKEDDIVKCYTFLRMYNRKHALHVPE